MTTRIFSTAIATAILVAVPSFAQTAAELLQKGIYAQETEGKLDDAIQIYRQIVNSAPNPREIGAQAQYRLAQALLQKGDTNGAAQEFSRLARDYSEYSGVITQLARQQPPGRINVIVEPRGDPGGRYTIVATDPPFATEFDPTKPISLTGKMSQIMWMNPTAWLKVESTTGGNAMTYSIKLASPNQLGGAGLTRATIKLGAEVTVTGILAKDGSATALANTISSEGATIFDRSTLKPAAAQ
jgi:tetratricopeptide (TPR) repeat protein